MKKVTLFEESMSVATGMCVEVNGAELLVELAHEPDGSMVLRVRVSGDRTVRARPILKESASIFDRAAALWCTERDSSRRVVHRRRGA